MVGIGATMTGYFLTDTIWYERIVLMVGGLMLVYPGLLSDASGIVIIVAAYGMQWLRVRCNNSETQIDLQYKSK